MTDKFTSPEQVHDYFCSSTGFSVVDDKAGYQEYIIILRYGAVKLTQHEVNCVNENLLLFKQNPSKCLNWLKLMDRL